MEAVASLRSASPAGACCSSSKQQFFSGGARPALVACNKWSSVGERRAAVSVEAKNKKTRSSPGMNRGPGIPNLPNVNDDDNPKFVLFIRTQKVLEGDENLQPIMYVSVTAAGLWHPDSGSQVVPLSIVSGGTTAKMMVAAMGNEWGKKLYADTLTRNIAELIYKDERAVRQTAFKTYPVLKAASGFEYGYKIVDKNNPNSALYGQDVIQVPPKGELKSVVDKVKEGFGNLFTGVKDTFGSINPIIAEDASEEK